VTCDTRRPICPRVGLLIADQCLLIGDSFLVTYHFYLSLVSCLPSLVSGPSTPLTKSSAIYETIYRNDIASEAQWLRLGATAKAESIDLLTAGFPRPLGALCEMGCGTGAVLEECMRRGLARNYVGVDASGDALSWIRTRLQGPIQLIRHDLEGGAPKLEPPPDAVVLSHVLEHLSDPQVLLASLRGKCGCLIAEVPLENQVVPWAMACLRSSIFGRSRRDNAAGHVQFFSKTSFRKLMTCCGWAIVAERMYLAYAKNAILYAARRNGLPLWSSLAPYFIRKLLGDRASLHLLCAHYAVLAVATKTNHEP
jgi:2-polyprenyl-3-methyl-5-hydroxy-6-metoxy-1,4-benzoquinol methylase